MIHIARAFANWYIASDKKGYELRCTRFGRCRASVYSNGVWHTWDSNGCGGENDSEKGLSEAKRQAYASCVMQGFI